MSFLAVTHTAHKIKDVAIQETEAQGLKYLADYIYTNMDPEDQASARQADEPMKVSMDIEGNGTKNVFCWRTSVLKDEKPTEGICKRWKNDNGIENGVVSFLVEIPDGLNYFVFPMGFTDSYYFVTVSDDPYQNFAFYEDFLTAENNANQMYAGINRKMKKELTADNATGTIYEEFSTREIGYDNIDNQNYTRVEVIDIKAAINGENEDDTAQDETTTETATQSTDETSTETTATPVTPASTPAPAPTATSNSKLIPPKPVPVVPLTGGAKMDTAYLKNWIENVIVNSKVLSGNYAVTITRDYKSSKLKAYVNGNAVAFKGLVDTKKYPKKVDYRGFTIKIDIGNNTIYEGKVHIVSDKTLIAAVGVEGTNNITSNTVFENIFTNASTNDPKAAGVSKGSMAKMLVTSCIFIETVDKSKKRMVSTQLLPSEVEGLKDYINDPENKELPEHVEFAINDKFGMEWTEVAEVVGALFVTLNAKIEIAGVVDLPNIATAQPTNGTNQLPPNSQNNCNTITQSTIGNVTGAGIPSNQKFGPNFDLATWDPWTQFGKLDFQYQSNTDQRRINHVNGRTFEDYVRAEIQNTPSKLNSFNEAFANLADGSDPIPGTTPLADLRGCDDVWINPNYTILPQNVELYDLSGVDDLIYPCYNVCIIVDSNTKDIVWLTTHSD